MGAMKRRAIPTMESLRTHLNINKKPKTGFTVKTSKIFYLENNQVS